MSERVGLAALAGLDDEDAPRPKKSKAGEGGVRRSALSAFRKAVKEGSDDELEDAIEAYLTSRDD